MTTLPSIEPTTRYRRLNNALQVSSQSKRNEKTQIRVLSPNLQPVMKIWISYKDEYEKAQKIAIQTQRELYQSLVRESKLHMEVIRLQAKLDCVDVMFKLMSEKKEVKS